MHDSSARKSSLFLILITVIIYYWLIFHENPRDFSLEENTSEFSSSFHPQISQNIFDIYTANKKLRELDHWERPSGPPRVAIQIGHWKADEAPDELESIRLNTGTSSHGYTEWETSLVIAKLTQKRLEENGITVTLLPTAIPENYWADIFITLHADGNDNASVSGYKVASPRKDYSGYADSLAKNIAESYGNATGLSLDETITPAMHDYYAFNWRKYRHSLHPLTVAAILETGFLTNATDRNIIAYQPDKAAQGVADGILRYLDQHQEALQ